MLLEYAQTVWDRVPDDYYWVELSVELLDYALITQIIDNLCFNSINKLVI